MALAVSLGAFAAPRTFYVAPDGKDSNKGTIDSPFATFNKALEIPSISEVVSTACAKISMPATARLKS